MARHFVGDASEIPSGSFRVVVVEGREFGIFNVRGRFRAVRNVCPHHGAPLCRGTVDGTYLPSAPGEFVWGREGEILRCPWHAWEFDLLTGCALFDERIRVASYEVQVQGETLVLDL